MWMEGFKKVIRHNGKGGPSKEPLTENLAILNQMEFIQQIEENGAKKNMIEPAPIKQQALKTRKSYIEVQSEQVEPVEVPKDIKLKEAVRSFSLMPPK